MPGVSNDKHRAQRRCPEPDLIANMLPINTSRARVSVGTTLALPPAKEMVGMRIERTMSEGVGALRAESERCSEPTHNAARLGDIMKKLFAVIMSVAVMATLTPLASAQSGCPPEVAKAKEMLSKKTSAQAPKSLAGARGQDVQSARGQDIQAPRSLAGARGQDVQSARGQDAQAARGQDAQAARGQDAQAARGQDAQAARGQDIQTARGGSASKPSGDISKASGLIKEAEAACKAGDMKSAKEKAEAAISALK